MLYALAVLFAFQLLGEFLARFTGLPLPGALIGTLLLLLGLLFYKRLPKTLEDTAQVLLQNMMLLFIPVNAGIRPPAPRMAAVCAGLHCRSCHHIHRNRPHLPLLPAAPAHSTAE